MSDINMSELSSALLDIANKLTYIAGELMRLEVGPANRSYAFLDTPLSDSDDFSLRYRSLNVLQAENITTLRGLIALTPSELRKLPNCGAKTMQDIIKMLDRLGLYLGMSVPK